MTGNSMNFTFRKLTIHDLDILLEQVRLYEEVFEMQNFKMPDQKHLQSLLEKEYIIFYVASLGNEVVGGLTAYILPSVYYASSDVYIYDLAVKEKFQRKGIGRKLIDELKAYSKQLGYNEIFVQADLPDKHALDFYKATGGAPEDVIHFTYEL